MKLAKEQTSQPAARQRVTYVKVKRGERKGKARQREMAA
jgi:hypothetical protein